MTYLHSINPLWIMLASFTFGALWMFFIFFIGYSAKMHAEEAEIYERKKDIPGCYISKPIEYNKSGKFGRGDELHYVETRPKNSPQTAQELKDLEDEASDLIGMQGCNF